MRREEEVEHATILSFAFVSRVDMIKKEVELTTTFDGDLPGTIFVKSPFKWNN